MILNTLLENKNWVNSMKCHQFAMTEKCYKDFIRLMDVNAGRENISHRFTVLNEVLRLYDDLIRESKKVYTIESMNDKSTGWKQKYDSENLPNLDYQPVTWKTKSLSDEDRRDIKQPTPLKQLNINEIHKPLWLDVSREKFELLIKDIANNLDNKDYQTTVDKRKYDLKNAQKILLKMNTKKIAKMKYRNCTTVW